MDRNAKEKALIKKFAIDNLSSDIYQFPQIDLLVNTYYINRENKEYIREYDFETVAELKKELKYLWQEDHNMSELIQPMIVAALKNKPSNKTLNTNGNNQTKPTKVQAEKLLPYIYNF